MKNLTRYLLLAGLLASGLCGCADEMEPTASSAMEEEKGLIFTSGPSVSTRVEFTQDEITGAYLTSFEDGEAVGCIITVRPINSADDVEYQYAACTEWSYSTANNGILVMANNQAVCEEEITMGDGTVIAANTLLISKKTSNATDGYLVLNQSNLEYKLIFYAPYFSWATLEADAQLTPTKRKYLNDDTEYDSSTNIREFILAHYFVQPVCKENWTSFPFGVETEQDNNTTRTTSNFMYGSAVGDGTLEGMTAAEYNNKGEIEVQFTQYISLLVIRFPEFEERGSNLYIANCTADESSSTDPKKILLGGKDIFNLQTGESLIDNPGDLIYLKDYTGSRLTDIGRDEAENSQALKLRPGDKRINFYACLPPQGGGTYGSFEAQFYVKATDNRRTDENNNDCIKLKSEYGGTILEDNTLYKSFFQTKVFNFSIPQLKPGHCYTINVYYLKTSTTTEDETTSAATRSFDATGVGEPTYTITETKMW